MSFDSCFFILVIRWSTWVLPEIPDLGTKRTLRALVFSVLVRCICQELGPVDYLLLHGCVALHYLSELSILGLPTRMKVILLSFAFYDSQAIFAIKFLRGCLFF